MRIIIHDYAGHPFQIDLSRELAKRNYSILHLYSSSSGGPKADFYTDATSTLQIIDIRIKEIIKNSFIRRALSELIYGLKLFKITKNFSPDLVISCNTPILAQKKMHKYLLENKIPHIHWLQDIRSVAIKHILEKKFGVIGKIIASYFEKHEANFLKESRHIINITDDFIPYLVSMGIETDKMTTIKNWAPIHKIPLTGKNSSYSIKNGFDKSFIVLYSGTLGMKHDPKIIYDIAKELIHQNEIKFVVVSEGIGMDYLKKQQSVNYLKNLILLPYLPFEMVPQSLGSADILLTILEKKAGEFSVPSKVLTGLCAGRPAILMVPEKNLAAKIVNKIEAGMVVKPGDKENLKKVILHLKSKPQMRSKMGENARRYAEKNFSIKEIADKFEKLIS